ncbi:MAG: DNA-binding response regulator [Sulfurovum sp.]|nr:MAG: DNA-binding response regulator [Sulfurovum sp.]
MEDDIDLGETIEEMLELEGYSVVLVKDGVEASEVSFDTKFDLYIFDINVPEFNGLELLEALRNAEDNTPTIFISALVDLETISQAFDIGAEDYIKKPFFPQELLIRIKAKFNQQSKTILYEDIKYTPKTGEIYKNSTPIHLSKMQMELFDYFMKNIDKIVTREDIMESTNIKSISALRVALTKLKQTTELNIKNIHGVGYRLEKS